MSADITGVFIICCGFMGLFALCAVADGIAYSRNRKKAEKKSQQKQEDTCSA